jgi:hypothetical protein
MRRMLMLPSLDEQQLTGTRGSLYNACAFSVRNYVAGDYLEFGVWRGDSFAKAYHALTKAKADHMAWLAGRPRSAGTPTSPEHAVWKDWDQRFLAFDSFEGLPEPAQREIAEEWVKGEFACSEANFLKNLQNEGVDLSKVVTVRGFYDKTLNTATKKRLGLTRAAVVHIDCDLYESTACVMEFVTDLLVQGSVLVFDDWFFNQGRRDMGEQQACLEWQARNPHIELIPYWQGTVTNSFIVNFRAAENKDSGQTMAAGSNSGGGHP